MGTYVLRRLMLVPVTLLLISLLFFFMLRTIPGDFVDFLFAEEGGSGIGQRITGQTGSAEEEWERLVRDRYGLADPIHVQYVRWISHLVTGDLGNSYVNQKPVVEVVKERLPATMQLGIMGLIGSVLLGVPLGIVSARYPESKLDNLVRVISLSGLTTPAFVIAAVIVVFLSTQFYWVTPDFVPFWDDPITNLTNIAIPAAVVSFTAAAPIMRLTRSQMLEVLGQDYIRTARAKGLAERSVFYKHALRNALLPVITLIGLSLDRLIAGSVIVEVVFGVNGIGAALVNAADTRDFPVLQAITLLIGGAVLFANLLVDVTYGWIDPRIRYD